MITSQQEAYLRESVKALTDEQLELLRDIIDKRIHPQPQDAPRMQLSRAARERIEASKNVIEGVNFDIEGL